MSGPALTLLRVSDPPDPWAALGFDLRDGKLELGGIRVELAEGAGSGIVAWGFDGIAQPGSIDGLPTVAAPRHPIPEAAHPNGAVGIDHVVITTPDFDRTAAALALVGLDLRRTRDSDRGRQGFRRVGPAILELVEPPAIEDRSGPARFWGLVVVVPDLDALAVRLGDQLSPPKPAVQPGRRIATLSHSAALGPAVAFMTPDP